MSKIDGIIDMADIEYVPPHKLIERDFDKYGWEDDPVYLKARLDYLLEELSKGYDLELAKEKQSLYFANDFHVRFN